MAPHVLAFDTVNHNILLQKLYHYGIQGHVHKWYKTYLSNRQQFVCISGSKSQNKYINTGVPQGSVLGPLLFIIYVNDIAQCTSDKCQLMLYGWGVTTIIYIFFLFKFFFRGLQFIKSSLFIPVCHTVIFH